MFVLVGGAGSGKTYMAQFLEEHGYVWIKGYTTRPRRNTEVHEYTAHLSNEDFDEMGNEGNLVYRVAYETEHGIWQYGYAADELENAPEGAFIILDPVTAYQNLYRDDLTFWYLAEEEDLRISRMTTRGDNEVRIKARVWRDTGELDLFEHGLLYHSAKVEWVHDFGRTEFGESFIEFGWGRMIL